VGAQFGEDAAVIDVHGTYLALALDPVTLSTEPGRLAVEVNANDIAVMGGVPRWLLAAVLLPLGSRDAEARAVFEQLQASCARLGVSLIGGHTEITSSVVHPVVAGCMIGEVAPDRLVRSSGAQPGDALILAGAIAVEGTAILGREFDQLLLDLGVPPQLVRDGSELLEHQGISILPSVQAMFSAVVPHAMHDPTEGGVISAVRELATASQLGVRVRSEAIPILPACQGICDALGLDPLGLLASGSLLAAVDSEDAENVLQALAAQGIVSACIGAMVAAEKGMTLLRDGKAEPLPEFERDELARWLEKPA
jgi:hydrogenase expression/formation protein HypE